MMSILKMLYLGDSDTSSGLEINNRGVNDWQEGMVVKMDKVNK